MKSVYKTAVILTGVLFFCSCVSEAQTNATIIDPVCGKKVDESESFDWSYAGKTYYFDTYDCRAAFKMNPQKFLLSSCTPNKIIIDLVCGMKVNMEESYDYRYGNKTYYFDSYECKQTFEMNPKKFIANKCVAPKDSVKAK